MRDRAPGSAHAGRSARRVLWLVTLALAAGAVVLVERALAPPLVPAAQEEELETFVPSEELPADSAVSFPADI